jgi:hypothetical protein
MIIHLDDVQIGSLILCLSIVGARWPMPSHPEWRDIQNGIAQNSFKLESGRLTGSATAILCVWLAFYVLAVAHNFVPKSAVAPVETAEAHESTAR